MEIALVDVIAPVMMAGGVTLASGKLPVRFRRPVWVFAAPLAFVLAYFLHPWTTLRPEDSWCWAPYLAVGGGLLAALHLRGPANWLTKAGVAIFAAVLLVPRWEDLSPQRPLWIVVTAAIITLLWLLLDQTPKPATERVRQPKGYTTGALLVGCGLAGAVVLFQSGSAKFAQIALLIGAVNFGCLMACVAQKSNFLTCGTTPVFAIAFTGMIVNGYLYSFSDVPLTCYLLVLAAPVTGVKME